MQNVWNLVVLTVNQIKFQNDISIRNLINKNKCKIKWKIIYAKKWFIGFICVMPTLKITISVEKKD